VGQIILQVEAEHSGSGAPLEVARFEEINAFVDQNGRLPDASGNLSEKSLARRIAAFSANSERIEALRPYDRHNLLPASQDDFKLAGDGSGADTVSDIFGAQSHASKTFSQAEEVSSLEDIFNSDEFAELDNSDDDLFRPINVSFISDRESPDEIAQRKICNDFYKFEKLFKDLHSDLKSGKAKAIRFQKASQVREGDAFILEGVLCLIDEIGEHREDKQGRYNPRLRVIFENGAESNHLLRSLAKRLYIDGTGRRIIRNADSVVDACNNISHRDKRSGQIYFVETRSQNPYLKKVPNLLKIGYTEQTVEERTKNSGNDKTFLEAPVRIVASMDCFNLNPRRFETLIHGFLHAQKLNMMLISKDGSIYRPQEWFSVSLETAMEVVKRIIDGSIVHYRMDNTTGRLVKKKA
jgi:hypothetical protein